jgi:hypothetical protein
MLQRLATVKSADCRKLVAERSEDPRPRQDARLWACQFSWEVSATRQHEVYRQVLGRAPGSGPVQITSPMGERWQ